MKPQFLILLILITSGCKLKTGVSDVLNNTGVEKLNKKMYREAILDFNKAITIDPGNPLPYSNRALAKIELHDYTGAGADCRTAITLNGTSIKALTNMAVIKSEIKEYDSAIFYFNRVIALYPDNGMAIACKAEAKLALKDYAGAIQDFTGALDAVGRDTLPDNYTTVTYIDRSIAEYEIHDYTTALKDINNALELDPNNKMALFKKGFYEYILHKYDDAGETLTQLVDRYPGYAPGFVILGIVEIKKGDKSTGCTTLQTALNLGQEDAGDTIAKYCK